MTNEELVKNVADYLVTHNKVPKHRLRNPTIQDAKVVYFEIGRDSNAMMALDNQTGEQIFAQFGPDRFLKQGPGAISGRTGEGGL